MDELQHGGGRVRWGREGLIAAPQGTEDFGLHGFFVTLFHFSLLQNRPANAMSVPAFFENPYTYRVNPSAALGTSGGQAAAFLWGRDLCVLQGGHLLTVCKPDSAPELMSVLNAADYRVKPSK